MPSASRSALHQLLDRSYHVIGGVFGDSRVIRARDAAQHEMASAAELRQVEDRYDLHLRVKAGDYSKGWP
jgi:hypothetical protein